MWQTLKKLVHDCLTENDGISYCPVRLFGCGLAMGGIPTYLIGGIVAIHTGHFEFQAFSIGFATMMGGLGALGLGVAAKAFTDNRGMP
jgi:hypothetical protein